MIQVNYPSGANSQFTYDGLDCCVKIVETTGSTKQFVWCSQEICEARDSTGATLNQYFPGGQTVSGSSYFYTRDQLGSIKELTDSSGNLQAAYSYDPYGRVSKTQGSLASDFQYAGYYIHPSSGLCLTMHRAYDPALGRFINRDPAGQITANLYGYVDNSPIGLSDPLGLWPKNPATGNPLPGEQATRDQLPGFLRKHFPCLTEKEATQIANDIVDALKWKDILNAAGTSVGILLHLKTLLDPKVSNADKQQYLPDINNLNSKQQKVLDNFLDRLPERDAGAAKKIETNCKCEGASGGTK